MYTLHTHCRSCGYAKETGPGGIKAAANTEHLKPVLDLGIQPLANDFRKPGEAHAGYAPLKVLFCPRCHLAQLSVVVDPHILYDRYSYVTSPSKTMADHLAQLTQDLLVAKPGATSVLEIGSNDGAYLALLKGKGLRVEGIDPAENLCALAAGRGVHTTLGLFGAKTASTLPKFDLVIARHVFCHVNDWQDFVAGLDLALAADGLAAIETPYVRDLLAQTQFDTIYHEHLSYLNLRAVVALLKDAPLQLLDVIHYPIHGGAILLLIGRRDRVRGPTDRLLRQIENERHLEQDWLSMDARMLLNVKQLREWVDAGKVAGKRVAALGASAKSTVWISACGFDRRQIAFIADETKLKWGTTSPGTDIPIVDEGAILREMPDYVVCFAWNWRAAILEKNQLALSKGVKFVFPIPDLEIIGNP